MRTRESGLAEPVAMAQVRDMEIISRILKIADAQGHNQQELERLVGLPHGRISRWKDGKGEPTGTQLARIADALRVPIRSLIDDQAEPDRLSEDDLRILEIVRHLGYVDAMRRLLKAETQQAPSDSVRTRPIGPLAIGPITSVPFDGDDVHGKAPAKPKTPTR
jgi:transcriptional regulator with XRE-family HTH domain